MKTLDQLKKSDFTKNNNSVVILLKKAEIRIEYDFYNDKWLYSSNDIDLSGDYYGSLTNFKTYLKIEIKNALGIHLTKYSGYGYHGGGRPRKNEEAHRTTVSISGTAKEIETLRKLAAAAGVTVSRFVLDNLVTPYKDLK